jgi:predicted transcriptional regulator of viral defense system
MICDGNISTMATATQVSASGRALRIIKKRGGMVRTAEAIAAGIHPRTLYQLHGAGDLEQISRGVYRLAEIGPITNPDLVTVASRVPKGVICLISALAFHEITTQIPHAVSIALKKGAESPRLDYPPISLHRFADAALKEGVQVHVIDGVRVRIFAPEKTLADCFKFRNKLGLDVALEALKLYKARKKFNTRELLRCARVCRVENVMRPYLEATV